MAPTLQIAAHIIKKLLERYVTTHLGELPMEPISSATYRDRSEGRIPNSAVECASTISAADRILIAASFWDMSFPAVLKTFFEHTSLFDITFTDNGHSCEGLCRCEHMLYITTRGMDIPDGDSREQATPYLRAISALWGLEDLTILSARYMDYSSPAEIDERINAAIHSGLTLAKNF